MTGPNRNLGASEPWGRATEKEIEELKARLRKLEGGRRIDAKAQSILADLVAKAEVQDQLLQDRLNFQDVVTYSTEPPFSNDTAEEDPNDGIGETFPLPDPSEPINPDNPGGDSSDSDFPSPDPDETTPEPEYRWVQEDPLTGVIAGEWTLVDGVWEPRQVGSDYVASGAIIRDKIEQAVLNDIDEANSNANEAVTAANGKNTNYRGPVEPTPPSGGFRPGDIWFDTSDPEGDVVINIWDGSDWVPEKLSAEGISDTIQSAIQDAQDQADFAVTAANGKNTNYTGPNAPTAPAGGFREGDTWFDTSGSVTVINTWNGSSWDAQDIQAELGPGSITSTHIADDAITTPKLAAGAVTANEIAADAVTAGKIAAGSITAGDGVIGTLDAGVITAGTLDADRIGANTITADKLIIGDFENLFNTVPFELGSPEGWEVDGSPSFSSWTADSVQVDPGTTVGRIRNTRFNVTEPGDQ